MKTGFRLSATLLLLSSGAFLLSCTQPAGGSQVPVSQTCTYDPQPATNPESGQVAGIAARHNYWRWRVGVSPLQWNSTLASMAQDYADKLTFEHDTNRSAGSGFSYVGENLYFTNVTSVSAQDIVDAWAEERLDYDFGTTFSSSSAGTIGHYTQIVWDDSTDIGCGYAIGDVSNVGGRTVYGIIIVCRYGPRGNVGGQTAYDYVSASCVDLDNDNVFQKDDADDTDRTIQ